MGKLNVKDTYFGYTDTIKQPRRTKVEKFLDSKIQYNNKIMSQKEYIYTLLLEGYNQPEINERSKTVKRYGNYEESSPKTSYELHGKNKQGFNILEKTLYDYAVYIINNNFIDLNTAQSYLDKELLIQRELERQKEIAAQEEEAKRHDDNAYEQWLEKAISNYSNVEKYTIAENIYLTKGNQINKYAIKQLLVLIENISNIRCRNSLISWLSSSNIYSKKVFYHMTGIKLPTTNKAAKTILANLKQEEYREAIDFKLSLNEGEEIFYICDIVSGIVEFSRIIGERINDELFISGKNYFYVTHIKTGLLVAQGDNKQQAIENAVEMLTRDTIKQSIADAIQKYGEAPTADKTGYTVKPKKIIKKPEIKQFHTYNLQNKKYIPVVGTEYSYKGFKMFITEENQSFNIFELETGYLLCKGKTKTQSIMEIKKIINGEGKADILRKHINDIISKNGKAPEPVAIVTA